MESRLLSIQVQRPEILNVIKCLSPAPACVFCTEKIKMQCSVFPKSWHIENIAFVVFTTIKIQTGKEIEWVIFF